MYGIFTKAGAMLAKFNAISFEQAENLMNYLIEKKPQINRDFLYLCKIA